MQHDEEFDELEQIGKLTAQGPPTPFTTLVWRFVSEVSRNAWQGAPRFFRLLFTCRWKEITFAPLPDIMGPMKVWMFYYLQKWGFWAILGEFIFRTRLHCVLG